MIEPMVKFQEFSLSGAEVRVTRKEDTKVRMSSASGYGSSTPICRQFNDYHRGVFPNLS